MSNELLPLMPRDLSWLKFNQRILNESTRTIHPILERARFLAIAAQNLDEFFMIRVPSLGKEIREELIREKQDNAMRHGVEKANILNLNKKILGLQSRSFDQISSELEKSNVILVRDLEHVSPQAMMVGKKIFKNSVLPKLGEPKKISEKSFLKLKNLSMALVCSKTMRMIEIPSNLEGCYIEKKDGLIYVFFLDRLVLAHAPAALGMLGSDGIIRLTRDADLIFDIENSHNLNRDFGRTTRLQYLGSLSREFKKALLKNLNIKEEQVLESNLSLCVGALKGNIDKIQRYLKVPLVYPKLRTREPIEYRNFDRFYDNLKQSDQIMHYPYDSFKYFETWLKAACDDPDVTLIQQTIYRAQLNSPVVELLKKAASQKKVRVIIEMRARFDEANNRKIAEELLSAGAEVLEHFDKKKVHAKVAMCERKESDTKVVYSCFSTGNFHSQTAKVYTDLALYTSNQELGGDAKRFFNALFNEDPIQGMSHLVCSPKQMRKAFEKLIDGEISASKKGQPAQIVAKMNSLTDKKMIQKLYKASQAGVKITLIVRGACSLVTNHSVFGKNIRVKSVVDRLLEHSRFYYFKSQDQLFISSADWMTRNLDARVETAVPIIDRNLRKRFINRILKVYLNSKIRAQSYFEGSGKI